MSSNSSTTVPMTYAAGRIVQFVSEQRRKSYSWYGAASSTAQNYAGWSEALLADWLGPWARKGGA